VVDFDVAKMLQNYLVTIAMSLGIPKTYVSFVITIHVTTYAERLTKIGLVFDDKWTTIVSLKPICSTIRMFSAETTGPIFTKVLLNIVALVASSSKTKPCYHLANVQRMHVVSVCLHYGNIIWLPWQRPLTNWKIRYRSIIGK